MHLMLDIEALSLDPRCAILSVGGVYVAGPVGPIIGEFYAECAVDDQIQHLRRHVMGSTIAWWGRQGPAARLVLDRQDKAGSLFDALFQLQRSLPSGCKWDQVEVWGNGSVYDIAALETAFADVDLKAPWNYGKVRCYRTLRALYPNVPYAEEPRVAHNALDDARAQALHLQSLLEVHQR